MGSNLVIVAIPARNDNIWKISSEQVPHLTMLFLGENADDVEKVGRIVDFVEHAVTVSEHGPFLLHVDERGTLGPDNADVVFFEKDYRLKWINQFRNNLLQQPDIRAAYESADQYPEWQPHLTLGYPATPANEDNIPDYGIEFTMFDRIAVWMGDFEGPEFKLRRPERELEVCMSTINEERKALGLDALVKELEVPVEHHGVKGMKWGLRKDRVTSGIKTGAKKFGSFLGKVGAVLADSHWQHSTYNDVKHESVHNHVAKVLDTHIERLQRSPKYRGKNLKTDTELRKTYYQDVAKVTDSAYRKSVKEVYGENFTGTKSAHYVNDARGPRIEVRDTHSGEVHSESPLPSMREIQKNRAAALAQSATTDFPDLEIELTLDNNGQISGVGFVKSSDVSLSQSDICDLGAEFIEHYGIKGMHWGIHTRTSTRSTPNPVAPKATSHVPSGSKRKTQLKVEGGQNHSAHPDAIRVAEAKAKLKKSGTAALSNQELRDVANRVSLENQVKVLTSKKGQQFVTRQLQNEGQNLARAGVREGVKRGVKKAGIAALA